jgi:hypothetical protein
LAPEYQGWKAPPRASSDRDPRKRKQDDDNGSVSGSGGNPGGSEGAVEQGVEPDNDEPGDFIRNKRLWSREMTQWAQEAVESLAHLGSMGQPLKAESVRSLNSVDFLPAWNPVPYL